MVFTMSIFQKLREYSGPTGVDLFRCESIVLKSHCVLEVIDQVTLCLADIHQRNLLVNPECGPQRSMIADGRRTAPGWSSFQSRHKRLFKNDTYFVGVTEVRNSCILCVNVYTQCFPCEKP